jgi:hypothetical protein
MGKNFSVFKKNISESFKNCLKFRNLNFSIYRGTKAAALTGIIRARTAGYKLSTSHSPPSQFFSLSVVLAKLANTLKK